RPRRRSPPTRRSNPRRRRPCCRRGGRLGHVPRRCRRSRGGRWGSSLGRRDALGASWNEAAPSLAKKLAASRTGATRKGEGGGGGRGRVVGDCRVSRQREDRLKAELRTRRRRRAVPVCSSAFRRSGS